MKVNSLYTNNAAVSRKAANKTSFNGFFSKVGSVNKGVMEYIEKGGFFAEFCIMDMCGMVLPRVYQGFHRNKQELGHLNYQAGMEEFLREFITGPSMFLIPIGAVILAGRRLGRGTLINSKLLNQFTDIFKNLGNTFAKKANPETNAAFASKLFDKFVANAEGIQKHAADAAVVPLEKYRESFVNQLTSGLGVKMKGKEKAAALNKFEDLIANINTSYFGSRDYSLALSTGTGEKAIKTTAKNLYLDARKYMEDVIPSAKLTFEDLVSKGSEITKEVYENTIGAITKVRENGRKLLCIGGSAALAGFLSIIPKIYQLSKKNPALNGIENTEGDKK